MGKRKLPIERIDEKRRRTVIKNKRRNGLIKKAVELSMLCDQKIYLVLYDPEYERLIQYVSHADFDMQTIYDKIQNLKNLKTKLSLRTFTNEDFYKSTGDIKLPTANTCSEHDSKFDVDNTETVMSPRM